MADDPTDAELREAAHHRGFRVVKSRIKTPGKADFGKFGLVDLNGKPVFGQGDKGLTASAREVADFLRTGAASTWAASVETTPARRRHRQPPDQTAAPPRRRAVKPAPPKTAAPILQVRAAEPGDAGAIAKLLTLIPGDAGAAAIEARLSPGEGCRVLVAEKEGLIGVIAWSLFPTLHRGLLGRITTILVAEGERRAGVGRQLFEAARVAMKEEGAALIEAVSDIEIRNSHGFFRALGFDQSSYRFARKP